MKNVIRHYIIGYLTGIVMFVIMVLMGWGASSVNSNGDSLQFDEMILMITLVPLGYIIVFLFTDIFSYSIFGTRSVIGILLERNEKLIIDPVDKSLFDIRRRRRIQRSNVQRSKYVLARESGFSCKDSRLIRDWKIDRIKRLIDSGKSVKEFNKYEELLK